VSINIQYYIDIYSPNLYTHIPSFHIISSICVYLLPLYIFIVCLLPQRKWGFVHYIQSWIYCTVMIIHVLQWKQYYHDQNILLPYSFTQSYDLYRLLIAYSLCESVRVVIFKHGYPNLRPGCKSKMIMGYANTWNLYFCILVA